MKQYSSSRFRRVQSLSPVTTLIMMLACIAAFQVALEVCLAAAYMANIPEKALGPVLWRRQQLAARGYKVVVVKEADWQEAGPEMQQMFLRLRFREAGVVLPAA